MKVGDLVKITRPSLGIPMDTVGVVLDSELSESGFRYFKIQPFGVDVQLVGRVRQYLARDLEVIR